MKKTRPFFSNSLTRLNGEEIYFSSLILSRTRETNSLIEVLVQCSRKFCGALVPGGNRRKIFKDLLQDLEGDP